MSSDGDLDGILDAPLADPVVDQDRDERRKRVCIALLMAGTFMAGVWVGFGPHPPSLITLILAAFLGFTTVHWLSIDSDQQGLSLGMTLRLAILLAPPLGFLAYCLTRRRFRLIGPGIGLFVWFLLWTAVAAVLSIGLNGE